MQVDANFMILLTCILLQVVDVVINYELKTVFLSNLWAIARPLPYFFRGRLVTY